MTTTRPYPLITAAELLAGAADLTVLDVQFTLGDRQAGRAAYLAGHVPASRHCDLDTVLAGPPHGPGGRHPLPDRDRLQADLRALGLRTDSRVVVYDATDGFAAARAWWTLGWAGLADVRVLDGGLAAWRRAGGAVATGAEPDPAPGDVVVRPGSLPTLDADTAARLAATGVLLDARARPRYAGEHEPIDPVAGHVPGARNAPVADVRTADGTYRTSAELTAWYAERGVDADAEVGTYCGSGVSAAQQVLALRLAGIDAALYVGSWSDWVSDPGRPVAVGDAPGQAVASPG